MSLAEQIFTQSVLLAGSVEPRQEALLRLLCAAAATTMADRLRADVCPEDCAADFVAAASLYALAALAETDETARVESFTAGEVTVRRSSGNAASQCLRHQADLLLSPYSKDRFAFRGI